LDEHAANWVRHEDEHDRNRGCRSLGRKRCWPRHRNQDINWNLGQEGRIGIEALALFRRIGVQQIEGAAIDIAQFRKALLKRNEIWSFLLGIVGMPEDTNFGRLL